MELVLFIVILLFLALALLGRFSARKSRCRHRAMTASLFYLSKTRFRINRSSSRAGLYELTKTLGARLDDSTKTMLSQSDRNVQIVKEITSEITKVTEGQKQIVTLNDQLRNLNDILKNTKQRGILWRIFSRSGFEKRFAAGRLPAAIPFQRRIKSGRGDFLPGSRNTD